MLGFPADTPADPADHYGGLTENWSGGPIYCSEITARLVHLLTGVPVHLLRPTPLDVTTVIDGGQRARRGRFLYAVDKAPAA